MMKKNWCSVTAGCMPITGVCTVQVEARSSRTALVAEVNDAEVVLAALGAFLGEPPNTDHAQLLSTMWTFACAFDRAYGHAVRTKVFLGP